jgi:TatD DNase family protein
MSLIDVHCHLDAAAYPDPEVVCQQSRDAGVSAVVAAGMGHASNLQILALHQRFPTQMWAALGFHPERLDATWTELEQVLEQIGAHRDRIVAMGEIGLPHYTRLDGRMSDAQAQQQEARLHTLVQAAARLALPVVLHAPHATAAVALQIVKRYAPPGAVFHWHKSSPETTVAICEAGYYISVTPEVCYRERDRQLVQSVPLRHLLVESDGPWAYDGEFAGQRTTPALVARVSQEIARLKGVSLAEVQAVTAANVRRVFGLAA